MSSETSEEFYHYPTGRHYYEYAHVDGRTVDELNSNLRDTKHNLRTLDKMLGTYRDINVEQQAEVDRLRDEVDEAHGHVHVAEDLYRDDLLRERQYLSDSEDTRSRSRKRRTQVKFADDMHRELQDIHGTVRNLSFDQLKMEDIIRREMDKRNRNEKDTRRVLRELNHSVRNLSPDPVAHRMERHLHAIQSEIKAGEKKDLSSLTSEVKHALHNQSSQDERMKHDYLASQAYKHKLDLDLEHVKKRLDESEGSRRALQHQVESLRAHLSQADQDRQRSKLQMEQARLEEEFRRKFKKAAENEYGNERKSIEREIHELKEQLSRSVSAVTEVEELRRDIDKSEKQRTQLSDHIETLVKEIETRDKTNAKLITELKDITDKYHDSERQKKSFSAQLEDVSNRFRETSKEYQQASSELRNTQSSLENSEKKKEEFKGRAQETVRQWKMKVKQLENELEKERHSGKETMKRNEQLIKEMEALRHNTNHSLMHVDVIKRDLAEALALRATQDEQIRMKEIEVSELKKVKQDLEGDIKDTRLITERIESELHHCQTQLRGVNQDRARLEDRLSATEASQMLNQDQVLQLQNELQKLTSTKSELSIQLADANGAIHTLQQKVVDLQNREKAARDEGELYKKKLAEERGGHQNGMDSLKEELNQLKNREVHSRMEVTRRFKHGLAEYEAMVNALKVDLSEEKSARKIAKKNEETLLNKVNEIERRLKQAQDENIALLRQMDNLREDTETRANFLHQDDVNRVKKLEDSLVIAQSELQRLEKNQKAVIAEIAHEIDELLIAASFCPSSVYKPLNGKIGIYGTVTHLIADVKNKLKWLKSEIEVRVNRENKWQRALQEVINGTEKDRSYLLKELIKQESQLEEVLAAKEDLVLTLKQCS